MTASARRGDDIVFVVEFVCEWLDHDHQRLDQSLWRFNPAGHDAASLRGDLIGCITQLQRATTP